MYNNILMWYEIRLNGINWVYYSAKLYYKYKCFIQGNCTQLFENKRQVSKSGEFSAMMISRVKTS